MTCACIHKMIALPKTICFSHLKNGTMILAVLASDPQKEEIAASPFFRKHEVLFSENISLWSNHIADAFIDLRFET